MIFKLLSTLGPSSLNKEIVQELEKNNVDLFRINLSHTKLDDLEQIIENLSSWSNVPICLDSEGAQVRNQDMITEQIYFKEGDIVKIHNKYTVGDENNMSLTPTRVFQNLEIGDKLRVDFNSVCLKIIEKNKNYLSALVELGGRVGSNKAADINRHIDLDPITIKDEAAFKIGLKMGIKNYSLSFTNKAKDVHLVRNIIGDNTNLISKIESIEGVLNLGEILPLVDQILIDRGDLSREVSIEKIPFIQRTIIARSKSMDTPVYVATNLLESMVKSSVPTRAEVNDVASTLLMGASGLVLAAETAIGDHPVGAVKMINSIIEQYNRWTPNSSCKDIIFEKL